MVIKKRYFYWCIALLIASLWMGAFAQNQPAEDFTESNLIRVLQSDASKADKAITCKRLIIYGTEQCVPALAPLLADKELSSWARIALEAIPGPAGDAALRDASSELKGRLLVGVVNSIGVRGDVKAVDILLNKLNDDDIEVASAAAVALGHIGGEKAAEALTQSLTDTKGEVRSAAAEGCILCAEQFMAQSNTAEAVKLYDTVRKANVPDQRHLEANRGAILARQSDGLPLLIEQLRSKDKKRLGIGLRVARELVGRDVTEALAVELDRLSPDRRPLLLLALADRNDSAVLPIVEKVAKSSPKELRMTAINILIHLGDISCVPLLLEAATEDDTELKQAAMETLVRLPGKDIDADIVARLPQAKGKLQQVLIELAGQRQINEALAVVASSLHDADGEIRGAAIRTISIIGQEQQMADLVKLLENSKDSSERSDIRKALLAISGRCGAKCIPHLKPLTESRDNELHIIGLRALAIVGGPEALTAVKSAIEKAEPTVQDEAMRILSNWPYNWPDDSDAGQALLKLATSAKKMSHQVLGLRGYLQYIRGNKKLNNEEKVAGVKGILSHIKRPEEKQLAIAVLGQAPSAAAFELLMTFAEDPAVVEEAYSAIVRIGGQDIPGVSRDQRRQVLQTVAEKSKNDGTRRRARETLRRLR